MGGRMAVLNRDLSARVGRLANFPFAQLMALKDGKIDAKSNPWMESYGLCDMVTTSLTQSFKAMDLTMP
jgi:hypothetical protein